ncbi:aspartate carbamoyltransferase catalytic subunit [Auritidibacter ignavus]|uniref:aspartate carbamoyltransferase catalytic subunit n=1 Tax=Auritidibacter ignavus TaxID=678932 RepID=UPI00244A8DF9|nr:aspartate carbamoyltransferase catalytic subunit [Auritidibacter ignavus]WGH84504.1 aspartate carbamoyltransferase catalytic subunit [Auritidibacter ignavus]
MRHLLSTQDLCFQDALHILDTAEEMAGVKDRQVKKLPALRGRTVVNLFLEDSTRTRISFEAAAKRLSADVLNFSARGSSVSKGESLRDTVQTLEATGADAIVMRHWASGAAHQLDESGWCSSPVVNAGDGTHEHPTQALLDAFSMRHRFAFRDGSDPATAPPVGQDLTGRHVVIVGDILHSRVARSNVWLLNTLGARVTLAGPATLMPLGAESWPCEVTYDLDEALATEPDAVMMLRIQQERMHQSFFPSTAEYTRGWGLTSERLSRLEHTEAIIMHPGPMNRGLEISSTAADSPRNTVLEQVANGVSIRMAVLYLILAAENPGKDG